MKTLTLLTICIISTGLEIKSSHSEENCLKDEYSTNTPYFPIDRDLNSIEIFWNAFDDYAETELHVLREYVKHMVH